MTKHLLPTSGARSSRDANTHTWNAGDELESISGTNPASFEHAQFASRKALRDGPFGRRLQATVNGTTRDFLYDGVNPVQELSGSTIDANMLDGLGVDEYFQRADLSRCLHGYGAVHIGRIGLLGTWDYLDDALGSTIALADTTGTVQTQYTYSPFGNTATQGQTSSNSFQFALSASRMELRDTGQQMEIQGSVAKETCSGFRLGGHASPC